MAEESIDIRLKNIRDEMNGSKAEISGTIQQLKQVINPGERRRIMKEEINRTTKEIGWSALETVKENPIPVALLGVGLTWLTLGGLRSGESQRNEFISKPAGWEELEEGYDRFARKSAGKFAQWRQKAEAGREKLKHKAEQSRDKLREVSSRVGERTGLQADRVDAGFRNLMEDHPFMVGISAVGLGALIGFMIPKSPREP